MAQKKHAWLTAALILSFSLLGTGLTVKAKESGESMRLEDKTSSEGASGESGKPAEVTPEKPEETEETSPEETTPATALQIIRNSDGTRSVYDPAQKRIIEEQRWIQVGDRWVFPGPGGRLYQDRFISFGPSHVFYLDHNGYRVLGFLQVGSEMYYMNPEKDKTLTLPGGAMDRRNGWLVVDGKYYFPNAQGKLYRNRRIHFGDKALYFLGEDGSLQTGFITVDGDLYYFDPKNQPRKTLPAGAANMSNAWISVAEKYYFPDARGRIYRNRRLFFGNQISYSLAKDGSLETGFQTYGEDLYYFDPGYRPGKGFPAGAANTSNAWMQVGGKFYFPNAQGKLYRNRPIHFGKQITYSLGEDGSTQTGFIRYGQNLYYFDPSFSPSLRLPSGAANTANAWITVDGKEYFPNAQGVIYRDRFLYFGSSATYYVKEDGSKAVGETYINGNRYRMDPKTGRILKQNGWYADQTGRYFYNDQGVPYKNRFISFGWQNRYYMDALGRMVTGFRNIDGNRYFFNDQGLAQRGWLNHGGRYYYFSPLDSKMYRGMNTTGESIYYFDRSSGALRTGYITVAGSTHRHSYTFYPPTTQDLSNRWLRNDRSAFLGQELVNQGMKHNGTAFRQFGTDLDHGADSSGAVWRIFHDGGIVIPGGKVDSAGNDPYGRVLSQYFEAEKYGGRYLPFALEELEPGDLIFSHYPSGHPEHRRVNHVAIYAGLLGGNPMVFHAGTSRGLSLDPLQSIPARQGETFLDQIVRYR